MNGQEIRDRLLHSYERSYDIVKPSEVTAIHTPVQATTMATKYKESRAGGSAVMSMRIFKGRRTERPGRRNIDNLTEWIEPKRFARGRKYRIPTDMYTLVTGIFLRTNRLRTA